jgi:hypothetical protein
MKKICKTKVVLSIIVLSFVIAVKSFLSCDEKRVCCIKENKSCRL